MGMAAEARPTEVGPGTDPGDPPPAAPGGRRIELVQPYANGDCLLATPVARQIKADFPGCHLTWVVSGRCREILRNNPYVDAVHELPLPVGETAAERWHFEVAAIAAHLHEAKARQARRELDQLFVTFSGGYANLHLYDGTVRGLLFAAYPGPISVPVAPVVRLDPQEIENVQRFVAAHPAITRCRQVALFECAPQSLQSPVNPALAVKLSRQLLEEFPELCLILSSNVPIAEPSERLIDASTLSFRENAELTKYCTLFIGCSSGLTWLGTSEGAKPLPTVQILSGSAIIPNSLAVDHARFGLPTGHILEMIDPSLEHARDCLTAVLREGLESARPRFHEQLSLVTSYRLMGRQMLRLGQYRSAVRYLWRTGRREGGFFTMTTVAAWMAFDHFSYRAQRLTRSRLPGLAQRLWPQPGDHR